MKKIYGNLVTFTLTLVSSICISAELPAYHSQVYQDKFVHENYFPTKRGGIFVDIGAHDGRTHSNTLFFEKNLGWTGICIEPIPEIFERLSKARKAKCIRGCIADKERVAKFLRIRSPKVATEMLSGICDQYDFRHENRVMYEAANTGGTTEIITVQCYLLNKILEENRMFHVNYLSLDTEGGELSILKSIDFQRFLIDVISVENNYRDPEFKSFLNSKGYNRVAVLGLCGVDFEEIYARKGLTPQ